MADVASARGAAHKIYEIIDRESEIQDPADSSSSSSPPRLRGDIRFSSVNFSYPSRADVPVLRQLSFEARSGQRVALVGASGCGKSTVLQLLQRFYDVDVGRVQIDGKDVKDYRFVVDQLLVLRRAWFG